MEKQVREIYHQGRKVVGVPDYVRLYLRPIVVSAPQGMRMVGYRFGCTCYGWSELREAWEW
jgi:hypothetical protein